MQVCSGGISGSAMAAWPYSVDLLCNLHWPVDAQDMGHFGVSNLEILSLFESWMGHRLLSERVTRAELRPNHPILHPSAPVSKGIEIRQGCQFISSLFRVLDKLVGGLGQFIPCRIGGHMSRLRHLGWQQCSHGITSRPLESCKHSRLRALCGLFGYPEGAAAELLDGTLKLRYCTIPFSKRLPPWIISGSHGQGGGQGASTTSTCDGGGNVSTLRVRLTRKSRPVVGVQDTGHDDPDPGLPTSKRWKRLLPPVSAGAGSEVGVPKHLFPRLGFG